MDEFSITEGFVQFIKQTVHATVKELNEEQSLRNHIMDLKNQNTMLRVNNKNLKEENWALRDKLKKKYISKTTKHQLFKKFNYRCCECGATNKEATLTVDHIIPLVRGGTDDFTNLQVLCFDCNRDKDQDIWENKPLPPLPRGEVK